MHKLERSLVCVFIWNMDMASRSSEMKPGDKSTGKPDLLLHPELLSEEFIKLVLHERKIKTEENEGRDHLMDLYIQHVLPLPQRELPSSRWAKRIEKTNPRHSPTTTQSSSTGTSRKRPLIVFDGLSTKSCSIKLKRADDKPTERLKPPPSSIDLSNPVRKLTGSSSESAQSVRSPTGNGSLGSPSPASGNSSNMSTTLKRAAPSNEAPASPGLKSPEVKKKIQHVMWP